MDFFSIIAQDLKQSGFLYGIKKELQTDILNRGDYLDLKADEIVFNQGDPAGKCYFVLSGCLKLTKLHEEGKTIVARYINPGELTAAVTVFRKKNYPVSAATVGRTELVSWDKSTMEKLMLEYPQLAINVLAAAIDRLDDLQNRYLELFAEQVERRVARTLLRIMRQAGRKTDKGILIDFQLTRQELAEYTGTTVYTVSRILSSWEKKGWIISRREEITVSDPHALVLFTEDQ